MSSFGSFPTTRPDGAMNAMSFYEPFTYETTTFPGITVVANTWTTVLSAVGQGYLTKFILPNNYTQTNRIRITVDGVIKVDVGFGGFIVENFIHLYDSNNSYGLGFRVPSSTYSSSNIIDTSSNPYRDYPYTGGQNGYVVLPQPIFFRSSLLLEGRSTSTTFQYTYSGGIK
jgi:hypothetical protein